MAREVKIYETYNAGAIKGVWLTDDLGNWDKIWETTTVQTLSYSRIFSLNVSVFQVLPAPFLYKKTFQFPLS